MGLSTMIGQAPGKLNFAAKGTLTVDGKTCKNIHIGQGHDLSDNNWWIGAPLCVGDSKANQLRCLFCGLNFFNGDNDHQFIVKLALANSTDLVQPLNMTSV